MGTNGCTAVRPCALETHTFHASALQNDGLTFRRTVLGGYQLDAWAAADESLSDRFSVLGNAEATSGAIQNDEGQHSKRCLSGRSSSPTWSACCFQESGMVSLLPSGEAGSQGMSRPRRWNRSTTAAYRSCRVQAAHKSKALPPAPQTKQWKIFFCQCTANTRPPDAREPCSGHGPRACWPTSRRGS